MTVAAACSRVQDLAVPMAPHLQSVVHVAGGCARIGVLPANTIQYGDLQ